MKDFLIMFLMIMAAVGAFYTGKGLQGSIACRNAQERSVAIYNWFIVAWIALLWAATWISTTVLGQV